MNLQVYEWLKLVVVFNVITLKFGVNRTALRLIEQPKNSLKEGLNLNLHYSRFLTM